jgi:hypothetical protein
MNKADWPAIHAHDEAEPFVVMGDATRVGQRGGVRWAKIICDWMNEQMRLGDTANKARRCDPMLAAKVRELESKVAELATVNADLTKQVSRMKSACANARYALTDGINGR